MLEFADEAFLLVGVLIIWLTKFYSSEPYNAFALANVIGDVFCMIIIVIIFCPKTKHEKLRKLQLKLVLATKCEKLHDILGWKKANSLSLEQDKKTGILQWKFQL